MRLYVPATLDELDAIANGLIDLEGSRRAHTATPALVKAYEAESITDIEEVEYGAFMNAADDSLMLIASTPNVPWKRLIISVDVPDSSVSVVQGIDEPLPASTVALTQDLSKVKVVCVHVDEPEASGDIQGVFEGKEDAIVALNERDLLWYDVTELTDIPR